MDLRLITCIVPRQKSDNFELTINEKLLFWPNFVSSYFGPFIFKLKKRFRNLFFEPICLKTEFKSSSSSIIYKITIHIYITGQILNQTGRKSQINVFFCIQIIKFNLKICFRVSY